MAKRKMNPLYESWGEQIRVFDETERLETWNSAKLVFDAVKDITEKTDDGYRLAQKRLSDTSGVSTSRIHQRYETIARMYAWGLDGIVSQPHSYYTVVQMIALTYNLTAEAKKRLIKQMDLDDRDALSKTSIAQARHYCKKKGTQRSKDSCTGDTPASPSSDLNTPSKIADALDAVVKRSKRAPVAIRQMGEWDALKAFIKKLYAMGEE